MGNLFKNGVSQDQYDAFKNKALNSLVRRTVNITDLILIDSKTIEFCGVHFDMSEIAFKSLVKFLGLSNTQMNVIAQNLGEDVSKKLISMMQLALSGSEEKQTICLVVNKQTQQIVDFTKSAGNILDNDAYFRLFEQTMNNHSGMQIKNMSLTSNGNVEISVLNNNWEFNVGGVGTGLNDEFFKSGLVFINTPTQTIVNPFNERLVCTNGMVATTKGLSLILKKTDGEKAVSSFFDTVTNLKGVADFEQEFKKRIILMMDTQASYEELLDVRENVEYHVANMTEPDVRETVEQFIPTKEMKQAYLAKNIDLNMVDRKKYKSIRTMYTVWELVNKLTDLSSHPQRYGLQLSQGNSSIFQLQKKAGELAFKERYDLDSSFPQLF